MSKDIIGVRLEPEGDGFDDCVEWHIAQVGTTDYDTACGIDANDPMIGHHGTVEAPKGQRVTCQQCYGLWSGFRRLKLRANNFHPEATR